MNLKHLVYGRYALALTLLATAFNGLRAWSAFECRHGEALEVTVHVERISGTLAAPGPTGSPDHQVRVVAGRYSIQLVEARTGRTIGRRLRPVGRGEITTWAFRGDGTLFAAANGGPRSADGFGDDGGISVWEVATGKLVASQKANALVSRLAFSPNGKTVQAIADEVDGW